MWLNFLQYLFTLRYYTNFVWCAKGYKENKNKIIAYLQFRDWYHLNARWLPQKKKFIVLYVNDYIWFFFFICYLFSSPEPKARVSYCHSAPSVRRRPSVRRKLFTFSTSSPEPRDGFWWNLVGMKYSWSLTSVVVFRPDPPRGGSRAGPK